MISNLLFIRLCELQSLNDSIISIYDALGRHADEEGEKICSERLDKRKKIKAELDETISKVRNGNKIWSINMTYYLLCFTLRASRALEEHFYKKSWNRLLKYELKNLNLYYAALYTADAPKYIIDILIEQKNRVENYVVNDL
ncbi:hypothetical protein C7S20_00860 [Christiangramia fulva]|uniref:Uncharacterized protein n=1 Tax=Christiangramia fulva TaxID=2126553 RepID=A0A2R3Z0Z0_9FLAO|nr:hypothetical protein [Christiangramia fulva]AVR43932.1 hypothetical protein C7S20_00860 [Christiangramia fulva]